MNTCDGQTAAMEKTQEWGCRAEWGRCATVDCSDGYKTQNLL